MASPLEDGNGGGTYDDVDDDMVPVLCDGDFLFARDPNTPPKTTATTMKMAAIPPYNSHFRREGGGPSYWSSDSAKYWGESWSWTTTSNAVFWKWTCFPVSHTTCIPEFSGKELRCANSWLVTGSNVLWSWPRREAIAKMAAKRYDASAEIKTSKTWTTLWTLHVNVEQHAAQNPPRQSVQMGA